MGGGVVPQPQAVGRDAALGSDGRCFNHEQASATVEQIGPMHQMPIVGLTIQIAGVLAHGSDHDAVGQVQGAAGRTELEGRKKLAHHCLNLKIGTNGILKPQIHSSLITFMPIP